MDLEMEMEEGGANVGNYGTGYFGGESLTLRRQRSRTRRVGVDVQNLSCGTGGVQVCDCGGSGATFI